jgi:hypothetical protein
METIASRAARQPTARGQRQRHAHRVPNERAAVVADLDLVGAS